MVKLQWVFVLLAGCFRAYADTGSAPSGDKPEPQTSSPAQNEEPATPTADEPANPSSTTAEEGSQEGFGTLVSGAFDVPADSMAAGGGQTQEMAAPAAGLGAAAVANGAAIASAVAAGAGLAYQVFSGKGAVTVGATAYAYAVPKDADAGEIRWPKNREKDVTFEESSFGGLGTLAKVPIAVRFDYMGTYTGKCCYIKDVRVETSGPADVSWRCNVTITSQAKTPVLDSEEGDENMVFKTIVHMDALLDCKFNSTLHAVGDVKVYSDGHASFSGWDNGGR
jgi:hypothetical protein